LSLLIHDSSQNVALASNGKMNSK